MTGAALMHRRRRSTAVLVLTVGLAALLVTVEILLFRSYTESRTTTERLDGLTNATTVLANAQREALQLQLELARLGPPGTREAYGVRRAFLQRQLRILRAHGRDQPELREELWPLSVAVAALDLQVRMAGGRPASEVRALAAGPAEAVGRRIKEIYDTQEHRLYEALGRTVRKREESQRLLVGLGGVALLIAGAVVLFLRMGLTRDFRRAYAALEAEVEERKGLQELLEHRARTDPLTDLANRERFREEVDRTLHDGEPDSAVIYLDLDYFKVVNDGFGHGAGDDVLQQAADRLRAAVRPGDSIARLGGDEFAVLLRGVDGDAYPREVAERLLETLHQPFVIDGHPIRIGASLGIALADGGTQDAERLIHDADVAMYTVKNDGKGAFRTFDQGMRAETADRNRLQRDLRQAVEAHTLELHYQPVVDLRTGVTQGLEALVRWQHPERGLLLPGEFLPAAEQAGLMVELGLQVLEDACRTAATWADRDGTPWVSVNLAPVQLHDPELPRHVGRALERSGLAPHRLVLEISERAVLHDAQRATPALEQLHALGVQIAVDDFGTGYTSLSYFRFLPISIIKIDRSLVLHISSDPSGRRLVAAIMRLAAGLDLQTIAEGIEDDATLDDLREMGCHLGQGFRLSRPLPAATVPGALRPGRPAVA